LRKRNRLRRIGSRERIEHRLLKRRIAARVAKKVVEDAIVEYPVGPTNRGLAILEGVPGKPNTWLNVAEVVLIDIVPGIWANLGECKGGSNTVGILEQV